MMTDRLYYKDAYLKEFDSRVTSCTEKNGSFYAVFERSAFYPEGGGQPCDTGRIITLSGEEILVEDVQEEDGNVVHRLSGPVSCDEMIHGEIDWERRFDHMQQHSGEHIVSGLICSEFSCDNIGFHMGAAFITIDYNAKITMEQAEKIEAKANSYIWQDHQFVSFWPSEEELKKLEYRSKKELSGAVRIASFPGADTCACCGTHVSSSAQVGLVKIVSAKSFHDGTRLELYCGKRAFDYLSEGCMANRQVAAFLSTKEEKTPGIVKKHLIEYTELNRTLAEFQSHYFAYLAESADTAQDLIIISRWLSAEQGRELADIISEKSSCLVAVFTQTQKNTWRYAVMNKGGDTGDFVRDINARFSGKGGGRGGFAQGMLTASSKELGTIPGGHLLI